MLLIVDVNPKNDALYVGAERVHGPAPRALPVIPVKSQGGVLVGGLADPAWYIYCLGGRTSTTGDIRQDTGRSIFGWIKSRFPTVPYADLTRVVLETDQRQVPRSHAEKYELKTIWYWYPLYCLGGISFVAFVILTITGILLGLFYVPDRLLEINPTTHNLTNPAWNSLLSLMHEIPVRFIARGRHDSQAR